MFKSRKTSVNRFAAASTRQRVHIEQDSVLDSEYPFRLNFYLQPPPADITIEEFELFALDRLQVLKAVETSKLRNRNEEEYKKDIQLALDKYLPMKSNAAKTDLVEERRKDHISHFVLRLAYCRSEESREWFLRQEDALFKFRFEQENMDDKKRFLETANLDWKVVDPETKKRIQPQLERCVSGKTFKDKTTAASHVVNETYFEVPFEKVPDLVRRRGVYVHKGKAYVPMSNQISLVQDEFKKRLAKMLQATAKALPRLEEDDRLKPILLNVEKQYIGKIYTGSADSNGDLKAADVDVMVENHAPLCMRTLHSALRRDKHLKHGGRMQYGLFLKAIGLSVEEALLFWRTAFTNKTDEQFQKEYAYNIRHNYGLEGKRVSYTAYSCNTIIKGNSPSTGDYHGCPFRHFSNGNLEARLYKDKIPPDQVKEIMNLVHGSHYQVACTKYFEITHPRHDKIDTIEHPNAYYELSLGLTDEAMEVEKEIK
ncbi:eukaryotic and archaeal DNA primase, large subunit-domain-containing protein [Halteromyces radiatus]|uniref:eukaryotic and archaeal DNA primase, large subunit-domain-containing protein n=1 Tax=Halteromyces radiatus TaxID=101107 RepID=UPI00221E72C3|nr:eukaryotic and archaeal DNA primase, large subunit-domain-containing protein [Halteromyces radiatus]KAI8092754.1 eukaryotic and archaeal DNA primase, large subunit-domain-containing protein [Halteromyces radiatus]